MRAPTDAQLHAIGRVRLYLDAHTHQSTSAVIAGPVPGMPDELYVGDLEQLLHAATSALGLELTDEEVLLDQAVLELWRMLHDELDSSPPANVAGYIGDHRVALAALTAVARAEARA